MTRRGQGDSCFDWLQIETVANEGLMIRLVEDPDCSILRENRLTIEWFEEAVVDLEPGAGEGHL